MELKKNILILGGASDLGSSLAYKFASNGHNIQLALRKSSRLKKEKNALKDRFQIKVSLYDFDVLNTKNHEMFISNLDEIPDVVICLVGYLQETAITKGNDYECDLIMRTNFTGPVNILNKFADIFEKRRYGTIVGISSVAGEKVRSSNYVYGSSKAGFTAYLSGLSANLHSYNVKVLTIIPGYIDTKMIKNKKLPKFLVVSKERAVNIIYNAIKFNKDISYIDFRWKLVILFLKLIPNKIFKYFNNKFL